MSDVALSASTIGKELLRIPIGTWERNCLTPLGCGRFNGATEYALSRGIQSQIDRSIYIGSSSGELSSTEIRPAYLKPRLAKPLEIFVADDQIFEQRFDSCVAGILEDAFKADSIPEIATLGRAEGQNLNFAIPVERVLSAPLMESPSKPVASSARPTPAIDAKAPFNSGNAFFDKKEYYKAISAFTEAIRLDPNNELAYCNRGRA